jgi:hypothetical protein
MNGREAPLLPSLIQWLRYLAAGGVRESSWRSGILAVAS